MTGFQHRKVRYANDCLGSIWRITACGSGIIYLVILDPRMTSTFGIGAFLAFLNGSFANDVHFEFRIDEDQVFHCLWAMVDGIYPELSRFLKTIQEPVGRKASRYVRWQELVKKEVEQAFGVLQQKF